jgi:UDP-N-acetylmuramoyl-L-alanyl-D-glutamate--2,6-diaminopimelate ligase
MEIIQREPFTLIDDTIGHPDSLSAMFEVVRKLSYGALHIVVAIRGRRGEQINRLLGQALGIGLGNVPAKTVVITRSVDAADERNRVEDEEAAAFLASLEQTGARFEQRDQLGDAIRHVLERVEPNDLVLLLGAQGMDDGAAVLGKLLATGEAERATGAR